MVGGGLSGLPEGYARYGNSPQMYQAGLNGALYGGLMGAGVGAVTGFIDPWVCFVAGTQVVVGIEEQADDAGQARRGEGQCGGAVATLRRVRYATRAIEDLREGQLLLARDQHDPAGPVRACRITRAYVRTAYHLRVVTIRDDEGREQTVRVTDEHPFHVAWCGWTKARELSEGDRLLGPGGEASTVLGNLGEDHPEGVTVYNLEVEDAHTYFVRAEGSDGEPVWVHNASIEYTKNPGRNWELDAMQADRLREIPAPNMRGTNNPIVQAAIDKGAYGHDLISIRMKAKGWLVDRADTQLWDPVGRRYVYPDAITPSGHPVEIKPRTPTGIDAGESQIALYEHLTGKRGRVVYYGI